MLDEVSFDKLRLLYCYPELVTDELIDLIASEPRIAKYIDVPLQHISDDVLKRMGRRSTKAMTEELFGKLAARGIAVRTTLIVGFPGETEEEFAETERFLKAIHFYEMHIFKYSRRAGTRAADMPDQVPEGTKSVRSDILLALEKQQSLEYRGRFLGTEEEILLEEPIEIDGTKYMMGHTRQYVKGAVPYEEGLKNKTVKGIFTKALNEEVLLLEKE